MTQQHPITPPPELAAKWVAEIYDHPSVPLHSITLQLVERAAQWGADQELEACCEWLQDPDLNVDTYKLRADRRPKTPNLKEQALAVLETEPEDAKELIVFDTDQVNIIRRALEQLDD
jgi:hypothetical protein